MNNQEIQRLIHDARDLGFTYIPVMHPTFEMDKGGRTIRFDLYGSGMHIWGSDLPRESDYDRALQILKEEIAK